MQRYERQYSKLGGIIKQFLNIGVLQADTF